MSYKSGLVDAVFILRWQKPEKGDVPRIVDEVKAAREKRDGPILYLAIAGEDSSPPDDDTRGEITKAFDELREHCSAIHLVIEGRGFRNVMLRSIATGVFLVSGNRTTFMHDTVDNALEQMALSPAEAASVVEQARQKGLILREEGMAVSA